MYATISKVRGDLVETLKRLAERVASFDGVIIETTGEGTSFIPVMPEFSETS